MENDNKDLKDKKHDIVKVTWYLRSPMMLTPFSYIVILANYFMKLHNKIKMSKTLFFVYLVIDTHFTDSSYITYMMKVN